MNCEEFRSRLGEFVRGELGEAERAEMEEHLRVCPDCRAEYEREIRIEELLSGVERVTPPQGLRFEILKEINRLERKRKRLRPLVRLAPAFAMSFILLVSYLWLRRPAPAELEAAAFQVDLLSPRDKEVYLPDEVKVVAALYPERDYRYRIYLDGEDVTSESKHIDGTILLEPEGLDEGYHRVLVEIEDRESGSSAEIDRVFYCMGGG